eukprot:323983-Prymnesium_polylepis.2
MRAQQQRRAPTARPARLGARAQRGQTGKRAASRARRRAPSEFLATSFSLGASSASSARSSSGSRTPSRPCADRSARQSSDVAQQFMSTPTIDARTVASRWARCLTILGRAPSEMRLSAFSTEIHRLKSALPAPHSTGSLGESSSFT